MHFHESNQTPNDSPMYNNSVHGRRETLSMNALISSYKSRSARRGLPKSRRARKTLSGPSGATKRRRCANFESEEAASSSSESGPRNSTSTWKHLDTCAFERASSSCASWFPARSSIWTSDRPRWISDTNMGEISPSNSSNPLVKAAPVFMTRPSSDVRIFRSCRNVAWSRSKPWPPVVGYMCRRKCAPSAVACWAPSSVKTPPHFNTTWTSVVASSSHFRGLSWSLHPLKKTPPNNSSSSSNLWDLSTSLIFLNASTSSFSRIAFRVEENALKSFDSFSLTSFFGVLHLSRWIWTMRG
mmetsp:Transcript_18557/g.48471  ORF Transcript_18557/g.48471 Transcript_18557/m.48471 type:complete len:299 (+) Transcript_18557:843-1739(+)